MFMSLDFKNLPLDCIVLIIEFVSPIINIDQTTLQQIQKKYTKQLKKQHGSSKVKKIKKLYNEQQKQTHSETVTTSYIIKLFYGRSKSQHIQQIFKVAQLDACLFNEVETRSDKTSFRHNDMRLFWLPSIFVQLCVMPESAWLCRRILQVCDTVHVDEEQFYGAYKVFRQFIRKPLHIVSHGLPSKSLSKNQQIMEFLKSDTQIAPCSLRVTVECNTESTKLSELVDISFEDQYELMQQSIMWHPDDNIHICCNNILIHVNDANCTNVTEQLKCLKDNDTVLVEIPVQVASCLQKTDFSNKSKGKVKVSEIRITMLEENYEHKTYADNSQLKKDIEQNMSKIFKCNRITWKLIEKKKKKARTMDDYLFDDDCSDYDEHDWVMCQIYRKQYCEENKIY